ncbi:hypothetical protein ACOSP7_032678 [Xanthoceras sorbifolium]
MHCGAVRCWLRVGNFVPFLLCWRIFLLLIFLTWVFATFNHRWAVLFVIASWFAWSARNVLIHGGSFGDINFWERAIVFLGRVEDAVKASRLSVSSSISPSSWCALLQLGSR